MGDKMTDNIIKSFTKSNFISRDILWSIRCNEGGSMSIKNVYDLKEYSRKEIDGNILYLVKSGYLIPYFEEDELFLRFNPLVEKSLTRYHLYKKFNSKEEIRDVIRDKKAILDSRKEDPEDDKKEINNYILKEKIKDLSDLYENFEEIEEHYKNISIDRNPGSLFESYLDEEYDSF